MKLISKARLSSAPWSGLPCVCSSAGSPARGRGSAAVRGRICLVAGMVLLVFAIQKMEALGQNKAGSEGGCGSMASVTQFSQEPLWLCWAPCLGRESSAGLHTSFAEDFCDRCVSL